MRKVFLFVFSVITLYFFLLPTAEAQNTIHPCESSTNYSELITCYRGYHFSHSIWECRLRTPRACRDAFSEQVDEKLIAWQPRPWNEERRQTYNTIMDIYDANLEAREDPANQVLLTATPTPSNTPTPTITPVENSVSTYHDRCKQVIQNNNTCAQNLDALYNCYQDIGAEDGVWSCIDEGNNRINENVCKESFINIIKSNMTEVTGNDCGENDYNVPGTTRTVSYNLLRVHFESKYNEREDRLTITPGVGIANPTIVITQAVTEDELTEDIVDDSATTNEELIRESWDVLNCGFANGEDEGKNFCCTNTVIDIDPNFSDQDQITESQRNCNFFLSLFGVCTLPDFSQVAEDKFTDYLSDNNVVPQLNSYTQAEGNLPLCLVGVPKGAGESCTCQYEENTAICERYIDDPVKSAQCVSCMRNNDVDKKMFYSALGCIDSSLTGITTMVFTLGLGIAGTVALFCIIYSAFLMQTSQGNPEKIQSAQQNITSCITGLILIIFSIFILRVIGVDLLRIPGFAPTPKTSVTPTVTQVPSEV